MPEVKKEELRTPFKNVFFLEAILFSTTLFLGMFCSFSLSKTEGEIYIPNFNLFDFLGGFIVVTVLFISSLLVKKRKRVLYKSVFSFTVWISGSLLLSIWMIDPLALLIMGLIVLWRIKKPNVFNHNLCMVLALSGIGGFFALSLNAQMVVFLLTAFSVYDFIAVYKTKHMQKIASEMVKYDSILAFLVPKTLRELKSPLGKSKERLFVLGGGDIVFPLLLSASLIKEDVLSSFIVAVFSLIGLYFSFWIFYKKSFKSAMPALPPIALLSIIGYLFVQIFLTI